MKYFTLTSMALAVALYGQTQIIEPGFEGGPGVYWGEGSTNFGTPLCDAGCGTGGMPNTGSWYAWFGGVGLGGDLPEEGWLFQNINIPNGAVGELSFYVAITVPGSSMDDYVNVTLDGTLLFSISPADSADFAGYVQVIANVSAWTDGQDHTLEVYGEQVEINGSNILFDDFSLVVDETEYTNITDPLNREVAFSIFPNPATDIINLQFNHADGNAVVSILDMNGQVVSRQQMNQVFNKLFTLDTSELASGLYQVSVELNGATTTQRVVVNH